MEITFHGAAQTVTGSQHLLTINGRKILLDCGLYQGRRREAEYRNRHFLHKPTELDALVLSHAHIDHSGLIPALTRQGFKGPIFATRATRDLCEAMLRDSGRIQESDAEYLNRRNARHGRQDEPPVEPLYTEQDAENALKQFSGQDYKKSFPVAPGVTATYYDAGHMLGSASVVLDIEERRNGGSPRRLRLAFSGDIGRMNLPILRDPTLLRDIDIAIMESTYGGRDHQAPEAAFAELTDVVVETVKRGGKLIIPSFAVGRAQEIVYELNRLIHTGAIPPLPVYVDSPLATDVSDVFREHAELYDEETRAFLQRNGSPLEFSSLTYTRSVEESKAINDQRGPLVIISASGMCETGRILHHLRNNIANPRNTILIVSWQAENTLGRRLADGEKEVKIFGDWYPVRAQVATINGYSGHAGHDLLVRWAKALRPRVQKTFLVHGEPAALKALQLALHVEGLPDVYAPQLHETVEV